MNFVARSLRVPQIKSAVYYRRIDAKIQRFRFTHLRRKIRLRILLFSQFE